MSWLDAHLAVIKDMFGNPGRRCPSAAFLLNAEAMAEWPRISDGLARMRLPFVLDRGGLAGVGQACGRWVPSEQALSRMMIDMGG